jgi:isocitrate dehydrogenase (NAD+)
MDQEADRVDRAYKTQPWAPVDLTKKRPLTIGHCPGDGISRVIQPVALEVLKIALENEIANGEIQLRDIPDLTIEDRLREDMTLLPSTLQAVDQCDLVLKPPLETPSQAEHPNVHSANVGLRQHMDVFACIRAIRNAALDVDMTVFRCNFGTPYQDGDSAGSLDFNGREEWALAFWPQARVDIERLTHLACLHAIEKGVGTVDGRRMALVFKDNVIQPDAKALAWAQAYMRAKFQQIPEAGVLCAKPDDFSFTVTQPEKRAGITTLVANNIAGDMIGDEMGALCDPPSIGSVPSANVSFNRGLFEAGGGTGTRMVQEGRARFASPLGMIGTVRELLDFIGYRERASEIGRATEAVKRQGVVANGNSSGATCEQVGEAVLAELNF